MFATASVDIARIKERKKTVVRPAITWSYKWQMIPPPQAEIAVVFGGVLHIRDSSVIGNGSIRPSARYWGDKIGNKLARLCHTPEVIISCIAAHFVCRLCGHSHTSDNVYGAIEPYNSRIYIVYQLNISVIIDFEQQRSNKYFSTLQATEKIRKNQST